MVNKVSTNPEKPIWSVREKNDPFVVPSFETISFSLPTVKHWEQFIAGEQDGWCYLSDGNPTLATLERLLAKEQKTESCWVTSTGKSAMAATLLALLHTGDHVIMLREGYKSTRLFVEGILKQFGVSLTLISVDDLPRLSDYIEKSTKLLILESPTNPMTRVPDLHRAVAVAKEHDIITVLDNSLAGFHQHSQVAVDVIIHSLSKYASGVGDVMGGAVLGTKAWVAKIKNRNVWSTDVLSAHAACEIWKGMQTYALRIERQSSNALAIAKFLEQHPKVSRVIYPGLPSHPDHQVAIKQMSDFGSVLVFDTKGGAATMRRTVDSLNVFKIAFGTGFTQSIANPAWLFYARSFPEAQQGVAAILDSTIRLSIGIEPPEILIADLEAALG